MRKLNGICHKERLIQYDKTLFVGNQNEIRYYFNQSNNRVYAQACFKYDEIIKRFMYTEWFQLSRKDIEDADAYQRTEKAIIRYFGYFDI